MSLYESIKSNLLESDDYVDPNYTVNVSNLYLTNGGYHNNADTIFGRISLLPKGKDSKLMPGHYDIIYTPEIDWLYIFEIGTDVREAVNILYNYADAGYDNEWILWNGSRIQFKNFWDTLVSDSVKNVSDLERDSILGALNDVYYNEKPFPLTKVNYQ